MHSMIDGGEKSAENSFIKSRYDNNYLLNQGSSSRLAMFQPKLTTSILGHDRVKQVTSSYMAIQAAANLANSNYNIAGQ